MFKSRFNKKIAFSNNSNLRFSVVRKVFYTFLYHKKGVVLLIVLGTLLVVASLATVILSLILSHARLTHHQTSRIQAYYAAMAGVNYALEQLRTGSCTAGSPCTMPPFASDDFKPASIVGNSISITIISAGSAGCLSPPAPAGGACVSATANYTYTTP
jgi:Tfp pilus assembly protein PilX